MKTHPVWTIGTLCWFFVLFNVERLVPAINLASFVYVLATIAGLLMLGSPWIRKQPFGLTAAGFVLTWIVGKSILGYAVDFQQLPLALTEVFSVVLSQYLCLKLGQNTDEFTATSRQLLEGLQSCSVPDLRDAEPEFHAEIRRARRHERPLTFISLAPGQVTPDSFKALLDEMQQSLSREYLAGCISQILAESTKSHDIAVRADDQFLILLPETTVDQAAALSKRLEENITNKLGVSVKTRSLAFGVDELTLSGILDRLGVTSLDAQAPETPEIYQLQPCKSPDRTEHIVTESAS